MSILKSTLRRIAIRNLDQTITKTYSNAIDSVKLDTIKDYIPKIPNIANIFKSIFISLFMAMGGFVWGMICFLLLKIFLVTTTALLISCIIITLLYVLMFIADISITEIPSVTTQPIYVKDNRYKSGQRFGKNINIANKELMIQFTKSQIFINVITSIILYAPSIIIYWIIYNII